jgi:uncharacterized membrane protein
MTDRPRERDRAPARPGVETPVMPGPPHGLESGTSRLAVDRLAGVSELPDLDLLVVVAWMAIAVIAAFAGVPAPLRLSVSLPAAILLPGYAIAAALFPPGELDTAERGALSFGLSLALIVVAAPLINLSAPGLNAPFVIAFVATITGGSAWVAWWRRRRHPGSRARRAGIARSPATRIVIRPSTIGLAALAIALGAYLVFRVTSPPTKATELSVVGPDGAAATLPSTVVAGQPVELTVRIASHEPGAQPYRIVVSSVGRRVLGRDGIVVDDGASEDETIWFQLEKAGPGQVVQVDLYRGAELAPYRTLSLVFDVVGSVPSLHGPGRPGPSGAGSSASPATGPSPGS